MNQMDRIRWYNSQWIRHLAIVNFRSPVSIIFRDIIDDDVDESTDKRPAFKYTSIYHQGREDYRLKRHSNLIILI